MKLSTAWRQTLIYTLTIFLLYSLYLYLRHGNVTLSTVNKSAGAAAAILAAVTLLHVGIRKQLGIMALVVGSIHTIISLFFIPNRFNMAYFIKHWIPVEFGLFAIVIWIWLALISNTYAMKKLGGEWRLYQSMGARIAFISIALHVGFFKYQEMVTWYQGKGTITSFLLHPSYPPGSLFIAGIIIIVLLYRKFFILK